MFESLKSAVHRQFTWMLRRNLPTAAPCFNGYFPHEPTADAYCIPKTPAKAKLHPLSPLPIPPESITGAYALVGSTMESGRHLANGHGIGHYLEVGRQQVDTMRQVAGGIGMAHWRISPNLGSRLCQRANDSLASSGS